MAKPKDTKLIAGRIDIRYHSRPTWFRWWKRWVIAMTALVSVAVVGYMAFGYIRHSHFQRMLNPSPVTLVHAHFENQCNSCHDADGKGGFFRTVSDNACLNCHDGSSHHPSADLHPGQNGAAHLINLSNPTRSADCMVCHTEHRGKQALRGESDQLCLQCHENLGAHGGGGSKTAQNITSFAHNSGHPEFTAVQPKAPPAPHSSTQPATRPVPETAKPWTDDTCGKDRPFHFNHNTHLTSSNPERGLPIKSCSTCHTTVEATGLPADRMAYMRPVNYEQHCRKCHDISLPGIDGKPGLRLVHDRLDVVRAQLTNLWDQYMQSPEAAGLTDEKAKAQWVTEQMKGLDQSLAGAKVADKYTDKAEKIRANFKDADTKMAEEMLPDDPDAWEKKLTTSSKAEVVVAMVPAPEHASCDKCHTLDGLPSVLYKETLNLSMQAAKAPAFPRLLQTVPTGIPTTPRRWFSHSEFSHGAHRDVQCLSCHVDMDKDKDDGIARMPKMDSCIECHHPPTAQSRGAGASCISCHHFHDRGSERPPEGRLHALMDVAPAARK